jgi:F-type H+-transporting ATPase subunit delta
MPLTRSAARRYAEAAFEIAERDDSMDAWLAALSVAEERVMEPRAMRFLANPAVPAVARIEVLTRLLGDAVSGAPHDLLALLVRRGRVELLPTIIAEFRRLHRLREGIVEATVTSAAPLDEGELQAVQARIEALTGKHIELTAETDEALLGGLVVRVGDQLIDGSVRGRLDRLGTELTNIAT